MDLLAKSDKEIFEIGKPFWENLVRSSNLKDYGGFTRDFSTQMTLLVYSSCEIGSLSLIFFCILEKEVLRLNTICIFVFFFRFVHQTLTEKSPSSCLQQFLAAVRSSSNMRLTLQVYFCYSYFCLPAPAS